MSTFKDLGLAPEFEITVSALLTAMDVMSPPPEKFISSTAPMKEKPLIAAAGTAANPIGLEVGITKLEVDPCRRTFPIEDSVVVLTAKTVLLLESNAAAMFRDGETAISPGELPAPRGETRGIVSLKASITTKLPEV